MLIFRKLILSFIGLYQRYISPIKGFKCAYGQLYKDGTCSSRISEIVRSVPLRDMRFEISRQFDMCASANKTIENDRPNRKDTEECNDQLRCTAGNCPGFF